MAFALPERVAETYVIFQSNHAGYSTTANCEAGKVLNQHNNNNKERSGTDVSARFQSAPEEGSGLP